MLHDNCLCKISVHICIYILWSWWGCVDVTRLIFKICYVSPLENNAMSLPKILIVSPLYMIMTVLTMVYGAGAIASDCAKFTLEGLHYFLL